MSWSRWLLCALCLVAVDGAWLFLLVAFLGFIAGVDHPPLALAVAEGVLLLAVCVSAVGAILPAAWRAGRLLAPLTGAGVVWLAVAVTAPGVGVDVGPGWPLALLHGRTGAPGAAALATMVFLCTWLWYHGVRRGRGPAGGLLIARSFRAGLVVLVTVLALESAGDLDLGTRAALAPFFIAALLGMGLARAPAHGRSWRSWTLMVGGTVIVVLTSGLVLASLLVVAVRGGLGALWVIWVDVATAASASVRETLASLFGPATPSGPGILPASMEPSQELVLLVLLVGAVLVAALTRRLLTSSRRDLPRVVLDLGEEQREDMDGADSRVLQRLLDTVMPLWRRRRQRRRDRRTPEPGITEVVVLYRRLLRLAQGRGVVLNPAHTPFERRRDLAEALPSAPVDALTGRFVAACYGREPSPPEVLQGLARALDAAAKDPGR